MEFKNIHIGHLINQKAKESQIETIRICKFFNCNENEVQNMYDAKSLDVEILLSWSKLLEYDFFRIYSHHLILFGPQKNIGLNKSMQKKGKSTLPEFRKNLYTMEIINFIIELISTGEKTKSQIINEYRIPKTTLYKWLDKYDITAKNK